MTRTGPETINVSTWLSLRFVRGTRYYQLHLEQELLGCVDIDQGKWAAEFAARQSADDLAKLF